MHTEKTKYGKATPLFYIDQPSQRVLISTPFVAITAFPKSQQQEHGYNRPDGTGKQYSPLPLSSRLVALPIEIHQMLLSQKPSAFRFYQYAILNQQNLTKSQNTKHPNLKRCLVPLF